MRQIVLAILLSLLGATSSFAGDCRKTGAVCSDSTPCKVIGGYNVCLTGVTPPPGGVNVALSCWKYTDTYECRSPNAIDYCQPLRDAACIQTNSQCAQYDWQGTCLYFTNTFRCGSQLGTTPTGVVVLDTTYTITLDNINTTQCDSLANNTSCTQAQEICVEGPETRNINGLPVYKDCWKWERTYACSIGQYTNYCAPLAAVGCTKTGTGTCTQYDLLGECMVMENTYSCDARQSEPLPINVTYLNSSYTITQDGQNTTACNTYSGNPNCTKVNTVCIEGPETRNINGLDVYKDCWKWEEEYACASETLVSNCGEYANNPQCQLQPGSECVDTLPGGQCSLMTHTYRCAVGTESTSTEVDCSLNSFCIDGNCLAAGAPSDTDIGSVITGMEVAREAGNYDLFKGEAGTCERKFWGLGNCCKTNNSGANLSNSSISSTLGTAALRAGSEVIKVYGSYYLYEALGSIGPSMLAEYAIAGLATLPTGSFTLFGLEFAVDIGAGITFVGFDPWSLAFSIGMYLLQDLLSCTQDEQILAMKRGQRLCHKVGTYCSQKVLGSCVTKTESHCCFPSRLGRIINEQGRPQIGKSWGTPKFPDCSGFTPEQMQNLRLDQMNLTEFINEIKGHIPARTSAFAQERLQQRMQSYYGSP